MGETIMWGVKEWFTALLTSPHQLLNKTVD